MLPPQHVTEAINRVQEFRGWILSSYAQIEYLFSDLVKRCCEIEDYKALGTELPYRVGKRLKRARKIFETQGVLAVFSERLGTALDTFEQKGEMRNILAHGFMIVHHDPNGLVKYEFRKWHWTDEGERVELVHHCFEVHLDYEATQLKSLADDVSTLFREIHEQQGWVG